MKDIIDLHTHTIASGHAYSTLSEMIRSAAEKGLSVYGCADHAPKMPGSTHKFYFINFKVIPRLQHGVRVLMGAELNILDPEGTVDLPESTLEKLDYTVASLHVPCFAPRTREEHTQAYVNVMKNPHVTIIGHPDDDRYPVPDLCPGGQGIRQTGGGKQHLLSPRRIPHGSGGKLRCPVEIL